MKERLLTIIIPVYNASKYINRCLDSVVNQSYKNLEIIIVDDGSTDGSGEICDIYSHHDGRIKVFHTKNEGSVRARQHGLNRANGEYIGFVDADDYIKPNMYEELVSLLEVADADFVASNYYEVRADSIKKVESLKNENISVVDSTARKQIFSERYFAGNHMIPYGLVLKVYKRNFITECLYYVPENQQYGEDSLLLMWMLIKTTRFATTSEAFYYYWIQDESLSHFSSRRLFENEFKLSRCRQDIVEINNECIDEKAFWEFTGKKLQIAYEARVRAERAPIKYHYYYENISELFGKKVVIYGAGKVGFDYYIQLIESCVDVVAIADINATKISTTLMCGIIEPYEIVNVHYDAVVIAILDSYVAKNAKDQLSSLGIPEEKIFWINPRLF